MKLSGENIIDYFDIGERVRQIRRERQMTQMALAKAIDVTGSFIGQIERAEKVASMETVARLSRALGVSMDWLVFGEKPRCERERCPLFSDVEALLFEYGLGGEAR